MMWRLEGEVQRGKHVLFRDVLRKTRTLEMMAVIFGVY
jgi:hypothetical protein